MKQNENFRDINIPIYLTMKQCSINVYELSIIQHLQFEIQHMKISPLEMLLLLHGMCMQAKVSSHPSICVQGEWILDRKYHAETYYEKKNWYLDERVVSQ